MNTKDNSAPMTPQIQYIVTDIHLFKCIIHTVKSYPVNITI